MFSVPPDSKPHDYPIPSWAKTVQFRSTGCAARFVVYDKANKVLDVHEKDWFANNPSYDITLPAGSVTLGATNWGGDANTGMNDLNVLYDVA